MSNYIICANPLCGRQVLIDGEPGERCLFCGRPVRSPAERIMSEIFNKKEVTMENRANNVPEGVIPLRPKKRKQLEGYFEKYREAILTDYQALKLPDFFQRWGITSGTWLRLKRKWGVPNKQKGPHRPQVEKKEKPAADITEGMTEHERYLILLGYQQAVREFLRADKNPTPK